MWGTLTSLSSRSAGRRRRSLPGLWRRLSRRIDPAAFRPRLADDIEIKEFSLRWGNDYAMICNPRALVHYRLEPEELEVVRRMDGSRTVKEIVVERFRESGDLELDFVVEQVQLLHREGFLDTRYQDVHAALERARQPSGLRRKGLDFLRTLSIEWSGADRLVRWLYHHGFRLFLTAPAVILGAVAGVAGLVAFISVVRGGSFSLGGQSVALEFLILLGLNYALTFLHELGHALVMVHYGRRVKAAGFMIYFGSPAFFIEASDTLMMERRQRILQAFAGPFAEFMLAGAASLYVFAFPDAALSPVLYKFAVLNYFVLFMNLIPLLELDGYWILSDLIQVPDLRPRSLEFITHGLWNKLRRRERLSRVELGLALYGIVGVAFAGFSFYTGFFFWREIFGSLIGRMWNGGPVTRALLVILALLVAGPLVRGAVALLRGLSRRLRAAWRALRFRLEQTWRVEAAHHIDALPLFAELSIEVLDEVAGRARLRGVDGGQTLVRQGERADAFYVVRRGTFQVVEEDPKGGAERVLRTFGPGDSFGELGLLESAPRTATVRALEHGEVFVLDKGTFDELLADSARAPRFAPTVQAYAELRALPCFSHLEATQLSDLLAHGQWLNIAPGTAVVEQGASGDAFYAVRSGQVEVVEDGASRGVLGPGSFFGEIALLLDVPRTATVRARTTVRAYRLDRDGFNRLVAGAFRKGTLNPHAIEDRAQRH